MDVCAQPVSGAATNKLAEQSSSELIEGIFIVVSVEHLKS